MKKYLTSFILTGLLCGIGWPVEAQLPAPHAAYDTMIIGRPNNTTPSVSVIPDTIVRLARREGATTIEGCLYRGNRLYFFPSGNRRRPSAKNVQVYPEPYYDSSGAIVAVFKRATAGMFMRAQHWEPATFLAADLVRQGIVWRVTDK